MVGWFSLAALVSWILYSPCTSFAPEHQIRIRRGWNTATSATTTSSRWATDDKLEHPLVSSGLAHAMLRVPSVNKTVEYYVGRGGNLQMYNSYPSGAETAFVNFAPNIGNKGEEGYFSLELTTSSVGDDSINFRVGNELQYIGLSMLPDFDKSNLESVILKQENKPCLEYDPNGIAIKSVPSAPGDLLARLCLTIDTAKTDLLQVEEFYTGLLGMEMVASDEQSVILRYNEESSGKGKSSNQSSRFGVPTSMVFALPPPVSMTDDDKSPQLELLKKGNCFDHLVIEVENIDIANTFLQQRIANKGDDKSVIFMQPTMMFGKKLMGIIDPSGYQVYLMKREKI